MPQSDNLANEVLAMRRLEAAYAYAEQLPERAKARVKKWAAEEFHSPHADQDEGTRA